MSEAMMQHIFYVLDLSAVHLSTALLIYVLENQSKPVMSK